MQHLKAFIKQEIQNFQSLKKYYLELGQKFQYASAKVNLTLLYYEIEKRNRKHTQSANIQKTEKLLLIYLGWQEMNGRRALRKEILSNNFSDRSLQKLIKGGYISHEFKPISDGRRFFYEVVHEVCEFLIKYSKHGLLLEGIDVNIKEVKKIIL